MTVLVTGAAGFIGRHLVEELINQNYEVIGIDNFSNSNYVENQRLNIKNIDVTDVKKLNNLSDNVDTVFHLAAVGSVARSIKDPNFTFNNNVIGTKNIIDFVIRRGATLNFASSSSIYGKNNEVPMKVKTWTSPISPYGASKLSCEAMILGYAESFKFNHNIFRFFNVFGPNQNFNSIYSAAIPKFMVAALKGSSIEVFGTGEQTRDFTYVKDLVKLIVKIHLDDKFYNSPVNLAFGNSTSVNKIIELIQIITGKNLNIIYLPKRISDIENSYASTDDIQKYIFEPTPINKSLRETLEFYKKVII